MQTILIKNRDQRDGASQVIKGAIRGGAAGAITSMAAFSDTVRNNYDNEAIMSLDGTFRPMSKFGGSGSPSDGGTLQGNLPHYSITDTGNIEHTGVRHQTQAPTPPLRMSGQEVMPPEISTMFLDFLADDASNTLLF